MLQRRIVLLLAAALSSAINLSAEAAPDQPRGEQCVVLGRARGAVVLVNRCRTCRSVGVEQQDDGGKWTRIGYLVAPASMVTVPIRGASGLRLTEEHTCSG